MRRRWRWTLTIIYFIALAAWSSADLSQFGVQAAQPVRQQEEQPATDATRPRSETKHYSVTVTVVTGELSAEAPVKGAGVTIFAGDHKETIKTGSDGQVLFKFDAKTKTATIRVVADHFIASQKEVNLGDGENDYRISLKKSD